VNRRPGVPAYLEQAVYANAADPNSPGAYRYDPESADPIIPDSDPRSPRYEPPHLRHRPADTWIIDRDRPCDPLDPGPYGSPGWYADKRTGRHRRGELPDPPPEAKPTASKDRRSAGSTPERTGKPRPMPGRSGDEPPQPPRRSRFWEEDDESRRHNFGKLREDAWSSFLIDSEHLHHAHFIQRITAGERWLRLWESLWAFMLRAFGLRAPRKCAQTRREPEAVAVTPAHAVPPIRVEWRRVERSVQVKPKAAVGTAKVKRPSPMSGAPSQGEHRANPVNPFMAQWERHFDATQTFREAVAL
jgi:hypothetical protein